MEKSKLIKKDFHGIIINDYEIEIPNFEIKTDEDILDLKDILQKTKEFSLKDIIEEKIYNKLGIMPNNSIFEKVDSNIKNYNIQIKELYGANRNSCLKYNVKNHYK